jgi:hypothetical protein
MRFNLNRRFLGTAAGKAYSGPPTRIFRIRNYEEGLPILHDFGDADRASVHGIWSTADTEAE